MEANLAAPDTPQPVRVLKRGKGRSRVTNGSKLLPLSDGRSVTARRFRDLYEDITDDLGGANHLSEGQRQLARRAAMLSSESERQEALACRGDAEFSIGDYGLQVSLLCRCLNILGVNRIPRNIDTGPLQQHFSKRG
jgi:hypothetical protein